ncbi:hypothetical protein Ataiwa_12410 [Algoriphagus taiwanensis]|uniref:Uncharacterized protein n=1 Tax=Algoriphagus taiwanensis TaxID=1445656 RepID=A0ABQ6PYH0_9BACT|nr:hypothetical protein Ataiwa_12410 [Algoriphagus taiwanensis]
MLNKYFIDPKSPVENLKLAVILDLVLAKKYFSQ